jgi:hypothetical protein
LPNSPPSAKEEDSRAGVKAVEAVLPTKGVFTVGTYTTTNPNAIFEKRTKPTAYFKKDATVTSPDVSAADEVDNEEAVAKAAKAKDAADNEEDEVAVDTTLRPPSTMALRSGAAVTAAEPHMEQQGNTHKIISSLQASLQSYNNNNNSNNRLHNSINYPLFHNQGTIGRHLRAAHPAALQPRWTATL